MADCQFRFNTEFLHKRRQNQILGIFSVSFFYFYFFFVSYTNNSVCWVHRSSRYALPFMGSTPPDFQLTQGYSLKEWEATSWITAVLILQGLINLQYPQFKKNLLSIITTATNTRLHEWKTPMGVSCSDLSGVSTNTNVRVDASVGCAGSGPSDLLNIADSSQYPTAGPQLYWWELMMGQHMDDKSPVCLCEKLLFPC